MYLRKISLHDFRNYEEVSVDLDPGINLICGKNGQGKTSLLEAVFTCATGRSFRTQHANDLIRHDRERFVVALDFVKHGISQRLAIQGDTTVRVFQHNSTVYQSRVNILGLCPIVVLTPDDAALVKGAPQLRRRYLDLQIAQADPLYVYHLTRYIRAMRQRNSLLRRRSESGIEVWEDTLAVSAAYLVTQRQQAVERLSHQALQQYQRIAGDCSVLNLGYRMILAGGRQEGVVTVETYREAYGRMRCRELEAGNTLVGPHRDDMVITLDGRDIRSYASEGQQRSCVAALRLAEWKLLHERMEIPPLMLIDDLSTSLDSFRRKHLLEAAMDLGQVMITSVDVGELSDHIQVNHIAIDAGTVGGVLLRD